MHTSEVEKNHSAVPHSTMRGDNEIALEFGIHPVQVGQWKKEIQDHAKTLFKGK